MVDLLATSLLSIALLVRWGFISCSDSTTVEKWMMIRLTFWIVTPTPERRRQQGLVQGSNSRQQDDTSYPGYDYKLPVKPKSATEIWNIWYGLDSFEGKPIEGGVAELVRTKGTKWRRDYESNENRMFSRWNCIIKLMNEEKGDSDLGPFLIEMDEIFETATSKYITSFYDKMKERRKLLQTGDLQVQTSGRAESV